jgi:hypothetical protein
MRYVASVAALIVLAIFAPEAKASSKAFIDFENTPSLPQGANFFFLAGPETDIVVPGVATVSGGVVLGDAANFPAISNATPPNVYATELEAYVGGYPLSDQITIAIDPTFAVDEVTFPLFNGQTDSESYTAVAYSGATQVAQQTLSNLPSNYSSGYGIIDLNAPGITSVVVTPANTSDWNYSVDSIAFNNDAIPEPLPSCLLLVGVVMPCLLRRPKPSAAFNVA